ncbi:translation initiation factor IF-2-like isoform X2 [Coturnix japonica]|uniref:translation initiation factor IF-2-like isoform X2 n=1 Tax=Coturnix japonica TaxID=93934 RepID=UPI0007770E5F|nr:translation initiation factor IF-2-like isoform X2 [Coturnix japonica]
MLWQQKGKLKKLLLKTRSLLLAVLKSSSIEMLFMSFLSPSCQKLMQAAFYQSAALPKARGGAQSVAQHPREWRPARMCRRTSRAFRVCSLGSVVSLGAAQPTGVCLHRVCVGSPQNGDHLAFSDVARAAEVPHKKPRSPAPGCFIAELPDNPWESTELSTEAQAASGTPSDPFWGLPPSPGFLSELQCGLSQLQSVVPPASARLSPLPTTLAVTTPPSAQPAQPIKEVQPRQPQVLHAPLPPSPGSTICRVADKKKRGSTKRAKRPAPADTPQKGESSQQEQPTSSAPAKKRKLLPCKERKERKGCKRPHQVKQPGANTGASSSGQKGTASELHVHLCESIQAVHPLGQRVTAVGPVRQPPSVQPQPTPSAGPAALQPQDRGPDKAVPAPPGSTARKEDAAKKTVQSCLRPSPRRSSFLQRDPLPQLHQQQPRPQRPMDFVPCVGPRAGGRAVPRVLEESLPITAEQRLERERMKRLAQEERQRAAQQMKIGPVQFLVQREVDMAIADMYGYL